jgi:hypothetical protein
VTTLRGQTPQEGSFCATAAPKVMMPIERRFKSNHRPSRALAIFGPASRTGGCTRSGVDETAGHLAESVRTDSALPSRNGSAAFFMTKSSWHNQIRKKMGLWDRSVNSDSFLRPRRLDRICAGNVGVEWIVSDASTGGHKKLEEPMNPAFLGARNGGPGQGKSKTMR